MYVMRAPSGDQAGARSPLSLLVTHSTPNVSRVEGDLRYERFGAASIQSAWSGAHLAEVLSELGRFDEAIERAEASVRIAEEADNPFTLNFGLFALGRAHLRRGDLPRATLVLERATTSAGRGGSSSGYRSSPRSSGLPTLLPAALTRRSR